MIWWECAFVLIGSARSTRKSIECGIFETLKKCGEILEIEAPVCCKEDVDLSYWVRDPAHRAKKFVFLDEAAKKHGELGLWIYSSVMVKIKGRERSMR
jgi:hypothetical protein